MYKGVFVLILLCFGSKAISAQDRDLFNDAVDYCNCKITYAYLEGLTENSTSNNSDKKAFQKIKGELSSCTLGDPINYEKLSALLEKNNFVKSNIKLSFVINNVKEEYRNSLTSQDATDRIINGIYNSNNLSSFIDKYPKVRAIKDSLRNEILIAFAYTSNVQQATALPVDNMEDMKSVTTASTDPVNPEFNYILLIATFVVAAAFIFLILCLNKLNKRLSRHRDDIDNLKSNSTGKNTTQVPIHTDSYVRKLEDKLTEVNEAIGNLQKEVSILRQKVGNQETRSTPVLDTFRTDVEPIKEVFFMSTPNKDGSFNLSSSSPSYKATASIYKFTIFDQPKQLAEFEFINEESALKDATNYPDTLIYPVCESKNALNQNAKRIITSKPGIARKNNDKWIVDKKAVIEYE